MENIDDYNTAIRKFADTPTNFVFTNTGAEHARIVMENIFRTSKSNIIIFAGDLNGDVSKGNYLVELENYLKSGHPISVLLEKYDKENQSEALNLLLKYKKDTPEKISISVVNSKILETSSKNNHFTIGDNRMFRFETDTVNYTAVCNFNDPSSCEKFNKIFGTLSKDSLVIN